MKNLYHMMQGLDKATFYFLPMLGKHPDKYPRFKDCFLSDKSCPEYDDLIHVYTKAGGVHRATYEAEIEMMQYMPEYVTDFDDPADEDFASFIFNIPDEWAEDFKILKAIRLTDVSDAYYTRLCEVYPDLIHEFQIPFGRSN